MATRTRYDFETVAQIRAAQRRAARQRLARLRRVKRILHFVGFLTYWAVIVSAVYLVSLPVLVFFVSLA